MLRRRGRPQAAVLVGRYELVEQVGEGGVGVVWRARDTRLERDVAIKLLRPAVAAEVEQRRRFDREARTLAGLSSDHIVRVFDYVGTGDQSFLVMEYVDGGNLAQATFGRLPLSVAEAAAYTAPVAHALAYAHGRGVVHRDLTPANILIERESGRVLTSDFGLARIARSAGSLTVTGVLIGTPEYWSPEQALGRGNDVAGDLYALGCILFLLLSGRLPFEDDDRLALGLRRAHENAPSLRERRPDAAPDVVALIDSLLAREPARRPDAATAATALEALAAGDVLHPLTLAPASLAPTLALASEKPSFSDRAAAAATFAVHPEPPQLPPAPAPEARPKKRRSYRRLGIACAWLGAALTGLVVLTGEPGAAGPPAPNLVSLKENVARAQIVRLVPGAAVSTTVVYSTRIAAGRVISQHPEPAARLRSDAHVQLVVSKGTPYAPVPGITVGEAPAAARSTLARSGFRSRNRFTPSWTVRKGAVIELRPGSGTRLHRPATVRIVIASGYPRAVVPNVENGDLAAAQAQLATKHLRYRVVYRLTQDTTPNLVLGQIPAAGATVYSGTTVRLMVSRTLRWVRVLAKSGSDSFESDPFTVPAHWRIRYRLASGAFGPALAQLSWAREGDLFGGNGFVADSPDGMHTYAVPDGAGTYRLAVSPYAGTGWYVEVDALE